MIKKKKKLPGLGTKYPPLSLKLSLKHDESKTISSHISEDNQKEAINE